MLINALQAMIEPAVAALGCELWGCEWAGAAKHQRVLRVYVDSAEGVTIDQCAKISRQIGAALDVENSIEGRYLLEVSSPGLERPLFTVAQCQRYVGQTIAVRCRAPREGRRNFTGVLRQAENDRIRLQLEEDQTELDILWREVEKAHLVVKF